MNYNLNNFKNSSHDSIGYTAYSINNIDTYRNFIFEGFDSHSYRYSGNLIANSSSVINNQVQPISQISKDYNDKLNIVNKNYTDLSNNIIKITNDNKTGLRDDMSGNYIYDYNTPFSLNEKPKTLLDGRIYDNNQLVVQTNALYVLGTITAASLIVFAILIGKE